MNILQFASSSSWTGEMSYVFSMTKGLLALGHNVTLVVRTLKKGQKVELIDKMAARYGFPNILHLNMDSGFYPIATGHDLRKLVAFLNENDVQILHCHRGQDHWTAVLARCLVRNKPSVVRTRHVTIPVKTHALNRWLYRHTHQVLATGKIVRDQLERSRLQLSRPIRVVHGGVDSERFRPRRVTSSIRREFKISPDECLICAVGHLDPVKGYEVLLQALATATKCRPELKCLIVGTGEAGYQQKLQALIARLEIQKNVFLTGFREDIPDIMAEADFGVLSSIDSEGNSRTALELMASGLAVVATKVGCLPDLVQEAETGYIITPGDAQALADRTVLLTQDKELRKQLGQKARRFVMAHYTEEQVAGEIESIYRQLLEEIPPSIRPTPGH